MLLSSFTGHVGKRLTFSGRPVIQPILFQVQSILIHGSVVKRAGLVVQYKIAPIMTLERSKVLRILCPLTCKGKSHFAENNPATLIAGITKQSF
jgi:hypothetical protein